MNGWQGIRVTLGCAHMFVRGLPSIDTGEFLNWRVGALAHCPLCPGLYPVLRQIVDVTHVSASRDPDPYPEIRQIWET